MEHCTNHPDTTTGRRCTRCGRPYCGECLQTASVGSHCRSCTKAAAPTRQEQRTMRAALGHAPLWAVKGLIAVNVAVFVLEFVLDRTDRERALAVDYGLWGPGIELFDEWWRLLTGGFLHADIFHLGMNMLALWVLGQTLEPALGMPRFGLLYATGLFGGAFGALLLDPLAITVGASGAIFGLMGALLTGLQARGINPFRTNLGGLLVINLLLTFLIPSISIGGHLGGLVGGGLAGRFLLHPDRRIATRGGVNIALTIITLSIAAGLWAAERSLLSS
jgi:membrane associated rhomboid family serine protease